MNKKRLHVNADYIYINTVGKSCSGFTNPR